MKQFFILIFLFSPVTLKAQFISIRDIDLKAGYLTNQNEDNSFTLIYKVLKRSDKNSLFKKIDFNGLLQVNDTLEINVSGNYRVLGSARSHRYEVFCFGSVQTGIVIVTWIDLETGSQQQKTLQRMPWSKKLAVRLMPTPDPEVFCVIHQLDKITTEVQFINPKGRGTVKSILKTGKKLSVNQAYLFDEKIILDVATDTQNEKKIKHQVLALDGFTGDRLYASQISDRGNMLRADQVKLIDSTLYFIGSRYARKKMNLNEDGMPVLVKVSLSQGSVTDTPIRKVPPLCFWVDLVQSPEGSLYGVGETFTSGTFGAYFAKAMATAILTLGIVSVTWNTMHFRDVVLVDIEAPDARPEILNLQHKRIQLGGHLPGYSFASYSYRTGQSRYFGTNGSEVFFLNGEEMTGRSLGSNGNKRLGKLKAGMRPQAFDIKSNLAIYIRQMNMQRTLDLQVVNFLSQ